MEETPLMSYKRTPVTKAMMIKTMREIRRLFLCAAKAVQYAEKKLCEDRSWRTDDLADSNDGARRAVALLRELL